MKNLLMIAFFLHGLNVNAQELFVYTEPASNMAAKSIGIRFDNMLMKDEHKGPDGLSYKLVPEIMWGVSKKIMIHYRAFLNNMEGNFVATGSGLYVKYRFFSDDDVHSHFRLAAYGKASLFNTPFHEYAINVGMNNSGYETGIVATKLVNKFALSLSGAFVHATDNINNKYLFGNKLRNAANYTFSVGKLMLPKEYTSYKQVNMNLMLEFLGQTNLYNGFSYLDIAPSVQFIFNSKMSVNLGYRNPINTKLQRYAIKGALLRLEYNFFNVY